MKRIKVDFDHITKLRNTLYTQIDEMSIIIRNLNYVNYSLDPKVLARNNIEYDLSVTLDKAKNLYNNLEDLTNILNMTLHPVISIHHRLSQT
ncbi:hypothetical protein AN643_04335 [Candidatus Epulonipiscioides saccharophilum]|nr:hypothetical protein AN643_04335 [Epulopiscium sp. SCG-B10WGA-EpuloB]